MFKGINTVDNKREMFEDKVARVYNDYAEKDIDNEYLELWNTFVEMIEFVQHNSLDDDTMSPEDAINLMREIGFTQSDMKELIKSGIKNDK